VLLPDRNVNGRAASDLMDVQHVIDRMQRDARRKRKGGGSELAQMTDVDDESHYCSRSWWKRI